MSRFSRDILPQHWDTRKRTRDHFRRGESRRSSDHQNDPSESKKIKVGANTITVKERDEYIEDAGLFGKFEASQFSIVIDAGCCDQSKAMTLIHELQHVFQFRAGLNFSEDANGIVESLIDACSTGFFDFFRDRENIWAIAEILGVPEDSLEKCLNASKK